MGIIGAVGAIGDVGACGKPCPNFPKYFLQFTFLFVENLNVSNIWGGDKMKIIRRIFPVIAFWMIMSASAFAVRYYVKPTGSDSNSGDSWTSAFKTIEKATQTAQSGDVVWVAEGTYAESKTVVNSKGVKFYGGFRGTESQFSQRDISAYPTIIDGENARQCVQNAGVLDGFHITRGRSDVGGGIDNTGIMTNCIVYNNTVSSDGGGIYNFKGTVTSCTVYSNNAEFGGGGIYNTGTVTNCVLYSNNAGYNGGGIFNKGTATNCTVYGNKALLSGGGIYNDICCAVINCIAWSNNNTDIENSGGEVKYSCFGDGTTGEGNIAVNPMFVNVSGDDPTKWDLQLQPNSPCIDAGTSEGAPGFDILGVKRPKGAGFDMGAYEHVKPTRYYVKPTGNDSNWGVTWASPLKSIVTATEYALKGDEVWVAEGTYAESKTVVNNEGVALYGGFAGTESHLSQRDISAHPTIIDGGGIRQCVQNSGVLDGFHITRGRSDVGGGIFNYSGAVTNCIVYENKSTANGGGIYNYKNSKVNNCAVYENNASGKGGGIYNESAVINCTVYHNNASLDGGGIYNDNEGTVTNCTVYFNITSSSSGIYNKGIVTNCIAWGNSLTDIKFAGGVITYSCFKVGATGEGNISDNPLFVNVTGNDPTKWDLQLQPKSPCIDAGTSEDAPDSDILGVKRPQGAGVDMGAYEYVPPISLIIWHILGIKKLTPTQKTVVDDNKDNIIDVADIVHILKK